MLNRSASWAKNPYGDSFASVTEPKIKRGAKSYRVFWQGVWNILTQEQKEKAAKYPAFLFGYIGSQSDAEAGFTGYVLAYLKATNPRSR
jgi:hypothetical protein